MTSRLSPQMRRLQAEVSTSCVPGSKGRRGPCWDAGLGTTTSAIWKPRFFGFGAFLGLESHTSRAVLRFLRRGASAGSAAPSSAEAVV